MLTKEVLPATVVFVFTAISGGVCVSAGQAIFRGFSNRVGACAHTVCGRLATALSAVCRISGVCSAAFYRSGFS